MLDVESSFCCTGGQPHIGLRREFYKPGEPCLDAPGYLPTGGAVSIDSGTMTPREPFDLADEMGW